jgi:sugar phosphate isomerase/epimerase
MKVAIQEDMLPGKTILEKFENARSLGVQGIEFWGVGLAEKVPDICTAIVQTGIVASAVNHARQGRLLDPDPDERERALEQLRQSVVNAVDIGAAGVILVPHFADPTLPDLTPYKSAAQLEFEMLHNHLRTLSDYVYAMGTDLYIEAINRYETHFLNTVAEAAHVRRKIKDHPHIKIAADLFHMAMEETSLSGALREYAGDIGYIHLADSNRRLPGKGMTDFRTIAETLRESGYQGWLAFECDEPGHNQERARQYMQDIPAALALLKQAGFVMA